MTGLSLAPSLAIRIILLNKGAGASTPPCNNSKSKDKITSPHTETLELTQISEFFSLPPLALFRSLIQVAFISQTAPFSSAAAARGTDRQCALSPGEPPLLLSHPYSGQSPLLAPFLPLGLSLLTTEDSNPRGCLFSHGGVWGTNTQMLYVALKIKNTSSAFEDRHQLVLNLGILLP